MNIAALYLTAGLSMPSLTTAAADLRRCGFDDMTPPLQASHLDDASNPAMLSVREGEDLPLETPAVRP